MPIYEYRCAACGKELEALQKLSEAPLKTCPACHGDTLLKRVSAAGFQLKGSGWYVTDFKGSGKPAPTKKDSAAPTAADAKGDGKSEASSEAKSEAKSDTKSEAKSEGTATTSPSGTGSSPASS